MLEILFTISVALLSYGIGYFYGRNRAFALVESRDASICSCTHRYSMHDEKGSCQVAKIKEVNYRQREFQCACVRYDGIPPAHIYMKDS